MARRPSSVCLAVNFCANRSSRRQMAESPTDLHTMDPRSACIQGVLKVKVEVKGHVICALFWILGMSYSITDSLVRYFEPLYAEWLH